MAIEKMITDNELYVFMNGELIYKRWLSSGNSKVFNIMAYDKYTLTSLSDLVDKGNISIHVLAKISLLKTEDGGRKSGILSGYRPNHLFDNDIKTKGYNSFMGQITWEDNMMLLPGEERNVYIHFLGSAAIDKYLNIGQKWYLYEGPHMIGNAEMVSFLDTESKTILNPVRKK